MNVAVKLTRTSLKACIVCTCMAVLLTATAAASVVDIPATATGHVTHGYYHSYPYYFASGPDMIYRRWWDNPGDEAWAKFDLSSIPDSSSILAVSLHWYQYEIFSYDIEVAAKLVNCDPVVTSAESLFYAILNGTTATGIESCNGTGWKEGELDDFGRRHVASCLDQDWVALGIHEWNEAEGGHGYGTEGGDLAPYLRIEYTSSGTREAPSILARQPDLALTPNPTTGRFITVRYNVTTDTPGKLTLRDVLGRTVKSITLGTSGVTRLDLRGLSPGVYMASL